MKPGIEQRSNKGAKQPRNHPREETPSKFVHLLGSAKPQRDPFIFAPLRLCCSFKCPLQIEKSSGLRGACWSLRQRSQSSAIVTRSAIFTTASRTSAITLRMAQRASSGQEHFS